MPSRVASVLVAAAVASSTAMAQEIGASTVEPVGPSMWESPQLPPMAAIGGGALLAIVGGVLWLGASSDASDLRTRYAKLDAMKPADQEVASSAATRGVVGSSLMAVGVLGAAGGTVWLLVVRSRSENMLGLRVAF